MCSVDQVPANVENDAAGGEDDADIAASAPSKDNVEGTSESVVEPLRARRLESSEVRVERVVTVRKTSSPSSLWIPVLKFYNSLLNKTLLINKVHRKTKHAYMLIR